MLRGRAYKRYIQNVIVKRRLKKFFLNYWRYTDLQGYTIQNPKWTDSIGSKSQQLYKLHTTTQYDSKFKIKYSPNKSSGYNRDSKKNGCRENDKRLFLKILKENGLK